MPQYLYRLKVTRLSMLTEGANPKEQAVTARHFEYLQQLAEQGTMILVGRTTNDDETTFGIAIFEAGSDEQAQAIMENDPAVREGVMTADLFPFRIALPRY